MEINKIKNFFSRLSFVENTHKYFVDGVQLKNSVSSIIKMFSEEVDFDSKALQLDNKLGIPEGSHKQMWAYNAEAACALGTKVHFFGELYPYCNELKPTNGYEEAIVKFWKDLPEHIVPVIMELQMYHKQYMFAGTGDILLYNKMSGKYIIGDYKTNKDLFKNFRDKRLTGIFSHLKDMPFNKYQIQLSLYQILFEQMGLEVEDRKVVWVKPDGKYEMYDCKDYTKELNDFLKENKV